MYVDFILQRFVVPQTGYIVSTMLNGSSEKDFRNGKTTPMSVEEIIKKMPDKLATKEKLVNELITKIKSDESNYIMEWGFNDNGQKTYVVNVETIAQIIKTKTLEKVIEQQFSSNHSRIYRLLSKCGALDLKNVRN